MKLCIVKGTVVATVKHPGCQGQTVLAVQPVDGMGAPQGSSFLAIDRVQAGVGDRVLVNSEGGGARMLLKQERGPIRSLIVGIVDSCDLEQA